LNLFERYIFCHIIHFFNPSFDQFNASLLNNSWLFITLRETVYLWLTDKKFIQLHADINVTSNPL